MDRTVRELIEESHQTALDHGWWRDGVSNRNPYEAIALMHSELSEALEELRTGHTVDFVYENPEGFLRDEAGNEVRKPEGYVAEMVDLYIRVADSIGAYELTDLFLKTLEQKLRYNRLRPFRHNKQA